MFRNIVGCRKMTLVTDLIYVSYSLEPNLDSKKIIILITNNAFIDVC